MPRNVEPSVIPVLMEAILNAQGKKKLKHGDFVLGIDECGVPLVMKIEEGSETMPSLEKIPVTYGYSDGALIEGKYFEGDVGKERLYCYLWSK